VTGASTPGSETRGHFPDRPRELTASFWLYIVTAAIGLLTLVISLAQLGSLYSRVGTKVSGVTITSDAIHTAIIFAVVGVVIRTLLIAFFALLMRGGARWSRIVLLILTLFTIASLVSNFTGGYGIAAVQTAVMIVAAILSFRRASSAWFVEEKAARLTRV
jgi:hypothetical protein